MKYADLPIPKIIQKWNVSILNINRNQRHNDFQVQNEFWTILVNFLMQPRYREIINNK